ncbi:MAG: hypothetical protein VX071_07460, partial [Candidatus Thermoplasmatota archaeon]|nr:hypothetical protein [Candidatus Thermoplasmatota archaeon]
GQVYRIAGAKKIDSMPRYSTSKLSYVLRFVPPLGVNTMIELWNLCHLTDLPLHHPFVDIESLQRVTESMRLSLIGVGTRTTWCDVDSGANMVKTWRRIQLAPLWLSTR